MADVREVVHQALRESNPALGEIQDQQLLFGELGISSIAMVLVITTLCERLDIDVYEFSEKDLMATKTVANLIGLFTQKVPATN